MTEINQKWKIGDCRDLMQELDPESIDLIVTDPPYGYSFMGKDWDKAVPPVKCWEECLRILKPGAFAFIMSSPRQDVLAHNLVNLSDAGFETGFTSIYWTFASGFPKSGNVSKLVDKRLGAEREVIGEKNLHSWKKESNTDIYAPHVGGFEKANQITAPATPQAKALDGSYAGFQPKPAVEIIMVVMKPLTESTYVDQALTNGKGITWLDAVRIPFDVENEVNLRLNTKNHKTNKAAGLEAFSKIGNNDKTHTGISKGKLSQARDMGYHNSQGRFPANLLVSDDVLNDGKERISKYGESKEPLKDSIFIGSNYGEDRRDECNKFIGDSGSFSRYFDLDAWVDEQIKQLPKEAQKTFPFLITPKASKSEKGENCTHPTVKPVKLISWLITIGSQKNDLVLDPFLGSGTTLEAGRFTGRRVLGFEISDEWEHLYSARCMAHQPPLSNYV